MEALKGRSMGTPIYLWGLGMLRVIRVIRRWITRITLSIGLPVVYDGLGALRQAQRNNMERFLGPLISLCRR
jgi:hypothetical protein